MNDDTLNAFQALETLKADARLKTIPILPSPTTKKSTRLTVPGRWE
jgi:hypothetical protein